MTTPDRLAETADMRIEVVKRELNQGALAGFQSSVTDYAARLVVAALDSFDAAALQAEHDRGVRDGKVLQTIFGNSLENLQAEYERGLQDGRAEGRRQAVEGWEREWCVRLPDGLLEPDDERYVRAHARAEGPNGTVVSRLVGPWEPTEPEHRFDPSSVRDPAVTPYSMFEESDDPYCICGGGWDFQTGCTTQQPGWKPAPPYDGPSLEELLPPAVD